MAWFGESADIVRDGQVGIVFEPENSGELVKNIKHLASNRNDYDRYRRNCLEAAKEVR